MLSSLLYVSYSIGPGSHNTVGDNHPSEIIKKHTWLREWNDHIKDAPTTIMIPPQASLMYTPLMCFK